MKKRYILLVFLFSFLPFIHIFLTNNLPHTSDGEVQIPRMAAFYKALRDGHIPVRWAGDLNYGYGMPLFNFIYHTPFYISSILIFLGFSLVQTFKFILFISFLLSGIFMFLFAQSFIKDNKKALIITLLYQFAPYHLIDILTRGAIGTIFVYSFFPLILWGLINQRVIITALSTALMVLSHNSMALIFFLISCLFVLFFIKNKMKSFFSLAIGLGLCAFYWIPALIEHKYTYGDLFMKDLFRVNFPPLQHFFIPNPLNHPSLRISEIALHWGLLHTVIIFFAILRWRKFDNQKKRITLFCFILIAVSMFFMHPISAPIWESVSFLRQFQFPWRFLSVIVFATSFLGIAVFKSQWTKKTLWFGGFIFLIVVPTLFYWRPTQGYRNDSDEEKFWNYPLNTTYFGETDVIWSAGPASSYPPSRIEIIEGQGTISKFIKKNHQQTFIIEAKTDARIVSHTQYFPGWRVYVNNKKTPIQFQDQNWRGLITFYVPKGNHQIRIQFEETPVRLLANIITLLSVVLIVLKTIVEKMFHSV